MMAAPSPSSSPGTAATTAATTDVNNWGPYSSGADFKGNALIILSVLFCAVMVFIAVNSIVRFIICSRCSNISAAADDDDADVDDEEKKPKEATCSDGGGAAPAVVFTKEMGASECAICLGEFVEGEEMRVLPSCRHGFHVKCVQRWLALRSSCPTCRTSANIWSSSVENV